MKPEEEDALRTVAKWLNEEIGGPAPMQEMAVICAAMSASQTMLLTSTARRKLAELKEEGYRVNGLAIQRGEQHGLITDFGEVLWWLASSNAQVQAGRAQT